MQAVGNNAPAKRQSGDTPLGKWRARMDWPAGLGALAMTVRPPPATAPATTAYLNSGPKPGTKEAR